MKKHCLLTIVLCALASPAWAQTNNVPYTLQNETDPMALGGAPAVIQDEALPATPPPGEDNFRQYDSAPFTGDHAPAAASGGQPVSIIPPYPSLPRDLEDAPHIMKEYPNNPVSAVPPEDTSKFENRIICTFEIAFAGAGRKSSDPRTAQAIEYYLDENAGKMKVMRAERGGNGEYSYCLIVHRHNDRARIYSDLKRLILAQKREAAAISLTGEGFEPVGGSKGKTPFSN